MSVRGANGPGSISCRMPEDLRVWLKERKPSSLEQAIELADDYALARGIVLLGTDTYDGSSQLRDEEERGKEDGHGTGEVTRILQEEEAVTEEAPDETELLQSETALENTTEWQEEGEVLPDRAIGETVMEQHTILDADPAKVFSSNSDHVRSD